MIEGLRGIVQEKTPHHLALDVSGVVYGMQLSLACYHTLPELGSEASVVTYLVVREDSMQLFAFASREERMLFERFIGVSGIGPKTGLAIVSSFDVAQLRSIIMNEDVAQMARVPGIGKKTAQRIILELKSVFEKETTLFTDSAAFQLIQEGSGGLVVHNALQEAHEALLVMGFTEKEAELALKDSQENGITEVGELVNFALRKLGGK